MNPCVVPTIPFNGDKEWIIQHKRYVAEAKAQKPDVILIGASIIQLIQCYPIWVDKFVPLNSLNFGICGDRTQDVLWRVQNDILDNIQPKVCILNVGSNNVDNTPVQIAEGILAIVGEIRSKLPDCYIIIIEKKVFLKAPSRINKYRELMPDIPLPPKPVITRWGSDLVKCRNDYFEIFKNLVENLDDDFISIDELKSLVNNNVVKCGLAFLKLYQSS